MPYRYTLRYAKESALTEIAGVCPDSKKFVSLVNQGQSRLMRRGGWEGTEILVRFCIHDRCVTLPRYIAAILGARFCNGGGEIKNHWYSIIGPRAYGYPFSCDAVLVDKGTAPTYNRISGNQGRLIRYYVKHRNDVGKTLTLYGKQFGAQALQERDTDNHWRDGLTITAAAPFGSTSIPVTEIRSIIRQATEGPGFLYEYDAENDKLRDLAVFEPNETHPQYRQSEIKNWCSQQSCKDSDGITQVQLEALVKLAFIPVVNENDFLFIDSMDALKFAIQSIRLHEADNDAQAEAKMLLAVKEQNFDLRVACPDSQIPVRVQSMYGCGVTSLS